MRGDPGGHLDVQAGPGCEQRQDGMGGARWNQRYVSVPGGREGRERGAPGCFQQGERSFVPPHLGPGRIHIVGIGAFDVPLGGPQPMVPQEGLESLARVFGLQLVGQHRSDRHGQVPGDLEHRQMGADHRVKQPLFPERIGAEPLHIRHVGMKDDREIARARLGRSFRHGRRRGSPGSFRDRGLTGGNRMP